MNDMPESLSVHVVDEIPEPLRVYIVEDSAIIQKLLASAIEAAGAEVCGCSAGAETAISELFVLQPDLIVIDISLASGSGFDVLRVLQEHRLVPRAVKVVLTNHAITEYENLCRRLGADRFYDKAMEITQAMSLIHKLAAEKRSGSAAPRSSDAAVAAA